MHTKTHGWNRRRTAPARLLATEARLEAMLAECSTGGGGTGARPQAGAARRLGRRQTELAVATREMSPARPRTADRMDLGDGARDGGPRGVRAAG
jgi:hypothetical protein